MSIGIVLPWVAIFIYLGGERGDVSKSCIVLSGLNLNNSLIELFSSLRFY